MRDLADREIQVAGRGFDTSGGKRPDADRKARSKIGERVVQGTVTSR